jgi:N-acetyl sugar amidotransferase
MNNGDVIFCAKCVISNYRPVTTLESAHKKNEVKPRTRFDAESVCDACRWAVMKETTVDWESRAGELQELCDKHRSPVGAFDVVVPASGGKDSMYVAHILKTRYGMNPLTVTWAPHLWTDTGIKNHQNLIRSGFTNILISPDGSVHRRLTRLAFEVLGHPFQPFIVGQRAVGPKVALAHNIKLVFYGENVAEYGNRLEDNFSPTMDPRLYTCFEIANESTSFGGLTIRELLRTGAFSMADFQVYNTPSLDVVQRAGIEVHYMSYYRKWVPQENFYYAMKNTFFEPAATRTSGSYSRYSGIDDKLEWLHYYMMYIKFGMGRATADASQEIRTGKITREEGIELVRRYDGEFPEEHINSLLEYLDLDLDTFTAIVDSHRDPLLWEKAGSQWKLKHAVG